MSDATASSNWRSEILLLRLRYSSLVIVGTFFVKTAIFVHLGAGAAVTVSSVATILAGAILFAIRAGRVPPRLAGRLMFLEWWAELATVICARSVVDGPTLRTWIVILLLGYSIGQLEGAWYFAAVVSAIGTWVVVDPDPLFVGSSTITFALMVMLSGIAWLANGALQRILGELAERDGQRAEELALALDAASHALHEREALEAERDRVLEQVMLAQRMEAVGRLASGIAHDMNNVLAGVVGMASLLRHDVPEELRGDIDAIISSGHRGAELTRSLLAFARHERLRNEPFDIAAIAEDVVSLLRRTQPKTLTTTLTVEARPAGIGDPILFTQALLNVCLNGVDASQGTGTIDVRVASVVVGEKNAEALGVVPGSFAVVSVHDDGVGMDEQTKAQIFEPFFTTKPVGSGTGLGLSLVYGTLRAHAGAVDVLSEPGRGSTFMMYLPIAPSDAEAPHEPLSFGPATPLEVTQQVLVVDDEPLVREVTTRCLRAVGFDVRVASDGAEALAVFRDAHAEIGAVILDMSMPHMGGAECLVALRAIAPDVRVILSTGFVDVDQLDACRSLDPFRIIEKPFEPAELVATVRDALDPTHRRTGRDLVVAGPATSTSPGAR